MIRDMSKMTSEIKKRQQAITNELTEQYKDSVYVAEMTTPQYVRVYQKKSDLCGDFMISEALTQWMKYKFNADFVGVIYSNKYGMYALFSFGVDAQ